MVKDGWQIWIPVLGALAVVHAVAKVLHR